MKTINNLNPKCITDFNTEDTLYMTIKGRNNNETFLCQFIEMKGSHIYGTMIGAYTNPKLYTKRIEDKEVVSVRLTDCSLYGINPITNHSHFHSFKASGYAIYPKDYNLDSRDADVIKSHPSFGMISLSRVSSSGGVTLFGSSIQHQETLKLTISKAEVNRNLSSEWYHSRNELIEIEMSSTQFSEFITSPNRSGVPCTIKHINHNSAPEPPYESKQDLFSKEFKNQMKNISTNMVENVGILEKILLKKSIGKADKEEIANLFKEIVRPLNDNIPFIQTQFAEQMDNTVKEAKGEVEAFISRRISEAGRKALLGEGKDSIFLIDENNGKK